MNKDIINKAIENPELLMQLSVDELEKISRQYPYFSAAKMLLSKSYKQRNDHRYADQMVQAALYSGNRKALFHWLKEPAAAELLPSTETSTTAVTSPVAELKPLVQTEEKLPVIELKATETPVAVEPEVIAPTTEVKSLVDLILNETAPIAELVEPAPAAEEKPTTPEWTGPLVAESEPEALPMDDMQRQILIDAVQSSIALEVNEDIEQQKHEMPETEAADEAEVDESSYAGWLYKRAQQLHFAENAEEKPENEEEEPQLGDWKHLAEDETEPETEKDADVDEILYRPETGSLSHPIKRINVAGSGNSQKDLIDKFIRSEPRIARSKSQEYTPGNIAKESLEEDFTFVTETMAILYAKQGRLDKAKKAFKKLMEQHPEKSVYFAAQLKNLDKFKKP
jgi:tetratricopeptide (TPR) repeat protein